MAEAAWTTHALPIRLRNLYQNYLIAARNHGASCAISPCLSASGTNDRRSCSSYELTEHDPPKIARKRFMVFFGRSRSVEEHIKSLPKFDNQKGLKYDATKDGRQWTIERFLFNTNWYEIAEFNRCEYIIWTPLVIGGHLMWRHIWIPSGTPILVNFWYVLLRTSCYQKVRQNFSCNFFGVFTDFIRL